MLPSRRTNARAGLPDRRYGRRRRMSPSGCADAPSAPAGIACSGSTVGLTATDRLILLRPFGPPFRHELTGHALEALAGQRDAEPGTEPAKVGIENRGQPLDLGRRKLRPLLHRPRALDALGDGAGHQPPAQRAQHREVDDRVARAALAHPLARHVALAEARIPPRLSRVAGEAAHALELRLRLGE